MKRFAISNLHAGANIGDSRSSRIATGSGHIVDRLIDERTQGLSGHPLWPLARLPILKLLNRDAAVQMIDAVSGLGGREALDHISRQLSLRIAVTGRDHIPTSGSFILAPNHPTGIADGVAMFDLLRKTRPDLAIFANRDALRITRRFDDVLIPVEWRDDKKSRQTSRETFMALSHAISAGRPLVLFPSGRIAYRKGYRLTERPWRNSAVALARRHEIPIIPVHIEARNSLLFYAMSMVSDELRDMTLFHELLNKRGQSFNITLGRPVGPDSMSGDISQVTARLERHRLMLRFNPQAIF